MNNTIYLRRKTRVYIEAGSVAPPLNYIASILKNIESLGYTLSQDLIERLQTIYTDQLTEFHQRLVADLQLMVGAHRVYQPMYPNFPSQVMEMSQSRLYINAILHYLTNRLPTYEKEQRPPLLDNIDLKVIGLGTKADFEAIFTNLASANSSLSDQDRKDLAWFVENYGNKIADLLPAQIPSKETAAYISALLIRHTTLADEMLPAYIKTATDLLRLAVALSGGDISLATNTRFRTFKRAERRLLLGLLERCGNLMEDMLRWQGRWIRLGEKLHPGEFAKQYPRSFQAFDTLRNDKPFETFNSKVEQALRAQQSETIIELMRPRPGDFARRLDHILRLNSYSWRQALDTFADIVEKVSTPVLLQVMAHFQHRNDQQELRTFFPKGELAKVQAIENRLPPLSAEICAAVVAVCEQALINRFRALPPLGRCYLDKKLTDFLVPFSQRSASKALRTIVRGSRLDLPAGNVIRFFLWWMNGRSRTDIDLSAALYDERFNYKDILSYYNLKSYGGHHSGDIVDAPEGAAEFIDIDIGQTLQKSVRYVVMSLNSFTSQPYCDLPECFAGWMMRSHANSGEIFEPRTVHNRIDVSADTKICIPAIIDLKGRQVIWTDIALKKSPLWNNVHNNLRGVSLMARALTSLVKPNLYDLFALHIKARGELVDRAEQADNIFAVDAGTTPFDLDVIASQYMA